MLASSEGQKDQDNGKREAVVEATFDIERLSNSNGKLRTIHHGLPQRRVRWGEDGGQKGRGIAPEAITLAVLLRDRYHPKRR